MSHLRLIVAWPVAWLLYGIGHAASRYVYWVNDRQVARGDEIEDWDTEPDLLFRAAWRVYQRFMAWSCGVSDWGGAGIWLPVEDSDA